MIKLREIRAKEQYYDYSSRTTKERIIDKQLINSSVLDDLSKYMNTIVIGKIKDGDKVYFDSETVYPRRKFNTSYPKNKLVRDVNKADTVVIDLEEAKRQFAYNWPSLWYKCNDGTFSQDKNDVDRDGSDAESFVQYYCRTSIHEKIRRINEILSYKEKNLVSILDIDTSSHGELDESAFHRIEKMLGSSDTNLKNMAMGLLTGYSYSKDKYKIALLVNLHWKGWWRDRKVNVEIKSMLSKLDKDFPSYRIPNHFPLWIKIAVNCEDNVIKEAFNHFVRIYYPDCPEIKIVKV